MVRFLYDDRDSTDSADSRDAPIHVMPTLYLSTSNASALAYLSEMHA